MASRTAISRWRDTARASSRLVTLAAVTASSKAVTSITRTPTASGSRSMERRWLAAGDAAAALLVGPRPGHHPHRGRQLCFNRFRSHLIVEPGHEQHAIAGVTAGLAAQVASGRERHPNVGRERLGAHERGGHDADDSEADAVDDERLSQHIRAPADSLPEPIADRRRQIATGGRIVLRPERAPDRRVASVWK